MKNYFYNKSSWTEIKSNVKKFAKYRLIDFTEHAILAINERGFSKDLVLNSLSEYSSEIVQMHKKGTYNSNKSDTVVFLAKFKARNQTKRLHVVVALDSDNGVPKYKIVTVYEPDSNIFLASGRVVKPRY